MAAHWIRRSTTAVAVAGLVSGVGATAAHAKPYENVRFDETSTEEVDDFCGDLHVRLDIHDQGHFITRPTGPDRLPRITATHHGGGTFTNLATGKAFTLTWNYGDMAVHLADNGDGTFTAVFQVPGPERFYGPDGQLLYTDGGTMRIRIIVDDNGTPNDLGDDFVVSEEFLGGHGGKPQDAFDFCDSFRTLTG
jgi:hypothetical protein